MLPLGRALASALVASIVVLASCTPQAPSRPEAAAGLCRASCSRRAECSQKVDEGECERDCRDNGSPWIKYWRPDYVAAATQCLKALPCDAARSSRERSAVCFASTRPAPSPAARRFAALAVQQDHACHVHYDDPPTVARLELSYAAVDDRVLEQMIECQERGCEGRHDTRWACVFDLVGIRNTY
jgi:hypothetical protein